MEMPIIVLGMHKSGTTLITEIIHHSGIRMIETDKAGGYDEGNKYERVSTNLLNKELLQCTNIKSLRVTQPLEIDAVDIGLWDKGKSVVNEINSANEAWGFKEPRTLMTFGFWKEILPEFKVICVFRDPSSVYRHYTKSKGFLSKRGIETLRAYAAYNLQLLNVLEDPSVNKIAVEYAEIMSGDQGLSRIEKFLDRKLVDRRNPVLNRSKRQQSWTYLRDLLILKYLFGIDVRELYGKLKAHGQSN